jgi:hypothetical protein
MPTPVLDRSDVYRRAAAAAGVPELTGWTRDDTDPARRMTFFLGAHRPHWLAATDVPLFVSAHTLARYADRGNEWENLPGAQCSWALDSGGFTELRDHGTWTMDADTFGGMVTRFQMYVGQPVFAAIQDWMCEPFVIHGGTWQGQRFVGTGLSVQIHQELTVESYLYLAENFPFVPWAPVLQGWTLADYLRCAEMYEDAGVDLAAADVVGLGSVCRRQSTAEIGAIVGALAGRGYRLHGFGVKIEGLAQYGHMLTSADSQAWSLGARLENAKLPGCEHAGPCNNCLTYALAWRERVLDGLRRPQQAGLDLEW